MNSILQRLLPLNRLALLAGALLAVAVPSVHGQITNISLGGITSYDGWNDLSSSSYSGGFPGFPGSSNWPRPIDSKATGSGDAELQRLAGGSDGGPFPASASLYFGSYLQVINELGGTLRVADSNPVQQVKTVVLQIQIGEADGYDFHSPNGAPLLKINGQPTGRSSITPVLINRYQDGVFESPETGLKEPVYVNTWGFQWDVSSLGTIASIQIDFSAVTHAQIYAMQLDQSSQAYATSVFDGGGSTETREIVLSGSLSFGNVVLGSSATRTLTITNNGDSTLNVTGISYPSAVFSGNWSGSIPAGGSQTVNVTFTPAAATTYSGNLTVNSDATGGTSTLAVSGTGLSQTRIIGVSGSLAFGNLEVGQTTTRTMTISNTGNTLFTVNSISYPTGFTGNWNSGTIAAGSSRSVTVTFAPTAATSYGGTITVNSDRTSGTNNISASGTGTAVATRIISVPPSLDVGSAPAGGTQTAILTIANTGNSPLNVTGITYPSGFSGDWSSGSIAAGSDRQVNVTFSPMRAGAFTGTISVSSDANGEGNAVNVIGSGTPPSIRQNTPGTAQYNNSTTSVTHRFNSTPNTLLQIEYSDNLTDPNSWVRHPGSVSSGNGQFDVTFTEFGDHRATWSRGMYFRLIYQK